MFQPRLGFTWDVKGNATTVVFGGWGLYYDRVTLNDIYDEQYRQSLEAVHLLLHQRPGVGRHHQPSRAAALPAILWNPSYLTADGLAGLIASGQTAGTRGRSCSPTTPSRRARSSGPSACGSSSAELARRRCTYANSEGYNGHGVELRHAARRGPPSTTAGATGSRSPATAFIMRSYDIRKTEYDGYFLTLDKPYTADSKWGFNFAYTYAKAYQNGSLDEGTAFAFDYVSRPTGRCSPANGDERHRFIVSGTVGLPFGFSVSSIITLGSGHAVHLHRLPRRLGQVRLAPSTTAGPTKQSFLGIKEFAYRSVDLRLEWEARRSASGMQLGLIGEGFNVLNYANYSGFDGWAGAPGEPNPNFRQAHLPVQHPPLPDRLRGSASRRSGLRQYRRGTGRHGSVPRFFLSASRGPETGVRLCREWPRELASPAGGLRCAARRAAVLAALAPPGLLGRDSARPRTTREAAARSRGWSSRAERSDPFLDELQERTFRSSGSSPTRPTAWCPTAGRRRARSARSPRSASR